MSDMVIIRATDSDRIRVLRFDIVRQKVEEILRSGSNVMLRVGLHIPKRSLEQNDMMWRLLHALSDGLRVSVMDVMAGRLEMTALNPEDMKDYMSAQFMFEKSIDEQRRPKMAVVGNGTMVMLGLRTSRMNTKQMSDFIEFLHARCAENGIHVQ